MDRNFERGLDIFKKTAPAIATALALLPKLVSSQNITPDMIAEHHFQCGKEVEGTVIQPDHVFSVLRLTDGNYDLFDIGSVAGKCGVTFEAPDYLISPNIHPEEGMPVSVGTGDGKIYNFDIRYYQCGGTWGPMYYRNDHLLRVDRFENTQAEDDFVYSPRNLGPKPECASKAS